MFHCDGNCLDTIENTHQEIMGDPRSSSYITRLLLEQLVSNMLKTEPRLPAKNVVDVSRRLIKRVEKQFGVSVYGPVDNTNGEIVTSSEIKPRIMRRPPQLPPDDDLTPSSSPSRSQSPPHKSHNNSTSRSSKRQSNSTTAIPRSGGRDPHGVPDSSRPPSNTASANLNSLPQQEQQNQQALARPTLSIDEGHDWKRKHKNKESAPLPGRENLTSLNERDHVSANVLSSLSLADRWH